MEGLPFAGATLDRLEERRGARDFLDNARPTARVAVLSGGSVAVHEDQSGETRALLFDASVLTALDPGEVAVLGERDGTLYLTAQLPEPDLVDLAAAQGGRLAELRPMGAILPAWDAGLLAYARGLLAWHGASRFCGACGAPTVPRDGGHRRDCTGCGRLAFPRTDVAVIGVVARGDRCLLVNQPQWAPRHFATVAGFLEPGESLEESMRREVREEVGLELAALRYHASQPWPFPSSLMVGFLAEAAPGPLRRSSEIREAIWLGRTELAAALRGGEITVATPMSISFRLIAEWYGDRAELAALAAAAAAAAAQRAAVTAR
jgi:NAD+ diphosphatase